MNKTQPSLRRLLRISPWALSLIPLLPWTVAADDPPSVEEPAASRQQSSEPAAPRAVLDVPAHRNMPQLQIESSGVRLTTGPEGIRVERSAEQPANPPAANTWGQPREDAVGVPAGAAPSAVIPPIGLPSFSMDAWPFRLPPGAPFHPGAWPTTPSNARPTTAAAAGGTAIRLGPQGVQVQVGNLQLDTRNDEVRVNGTPLSSPDDRMEWPPSAAAAVAGVPLPNVAALRSLALARLAFERQQYATAEEQLNVAVEAQPADPELRQLRSLARFAQQKYGPAAEDARQALAVSEPWNWKQLSSLYAETDSYTQQYRALQHAAQAEPNRGAWLLLLAYHDRMLGHGSEARETLRRAAELAPGDPVLERLRSQW